MLTRAKPSVCFGYFLMALLLCLNGQPVQAQAQRIALVIGNANYLNAQLNNPINDAKAIARSLQKLGFEVQLSTDLKTHEMRQNIQRFAASTATQKVLYFAGHGKQIGGKNYLLPTNVAFQKQGRALSPSEVQADAIGLDAIMSALPRSNNQATVIILDACRDDIEALTMRGATAKSDDGFAALVPPTGVFIAFATGAGALAEDGPAGGHGLFTQHLLKHIGTPNMRIEDLFKAVRRDVQKLAKKPQTPWETTSLVGDFYFSQKP